MKPNLAFMNKEYILYNLKEGLEQLINIINELETNKEYEFAEYKVQMEHLYHHINTAWNARDSSEKESIDCSEKDFEIWRKFPKDTEMF